jgi:cytochrome c-type biogenesis protein CcmH/NrfF
MSDPTVDQHIADELMAAMLLMAFAMADMVPAGGLLTGGGMWWAAGRKRAASSAVITLWVPQDSGVVGTFNESLGVRVTLAPSATSMSVLLWDGVGSYVTVATGTPTEVTAKKFRIFAAPGTAKALWYLSTADAAVSLEKHGYV